MHHEHCTIVVNKIILLNSILVVRIISPPFFVRLHLENIICQMVLQKKIIKENVLCLRERSPTWPLSAQSLPRAETLGFPWKILPPPPALLQPPPCLFLFLRPGPPTFFSLCFLLFPFFFSSSFFFFSLSLLILSLSWPHNARDATQHHTRTHAHGRASRSTLPSSSLRPWPLPDRKSVV